MHFRSRIAWTLLFLLSAAGTRADDKEFRLALSLDPLLEVSKVFAMSAKDLEAAFASSQFSENPYLRWREDNAVCKFSSKPYANITVDLSLLDGAVAVDEEEVLMEEGSQKVMAVSFACKEPTAESAPRLRIKLQSLLGTEPQPGPPPAVGWKSDLAAKVDVWSSSKGVAKLQRDDRQVRFVLGRPGLDPARLRVSAPEKEAGERKLAFFARLDQLLKIPDVWALTPEALDKEVSTTGIGLKENPFFKWNTTAKDSARFARNLFANTSTDLLLFEDSVKPEEANIQFRSGRASKVVYTLLTRGNSGKDITAAQFDAVFKATGRALGFTLGERPSRTTVSGKQLVKSEAWLWTTPHTLALLEYNEEAPKGKVEFLRLTLAPGDARAELLNLAGIGGNATTRSLRNLATSVKRDKSTGDVEITGVPMRDQGAKGYCVAASCERLFRYLGQPCDMDEIAKIVATDAERGTSPGIMYSQLNRIDQRYNMRLKLLKLQDGLALGDEGKGRGRGTSSRDRNKENSRYYSADLAKLIKANIDQGIPLLWSVALPIGQDGITPDTKVRPVVTTKPGQGLPGMGFDVQRVGHMRLIIGYNATTGGIIYTDSWGAGHERKIMPYSEAQEMTTAVFSMSPSQ